MNEIRENIVMLLEQKILYTFVAVPCIHSFIFFLIYERIYEIVWSSITKVVTDSKRKNDNNVKLMDRK